MDGYIKIFILTQFNWVRYIAIYYKNGLFLFTEVRKKTRSTKRVVKTSEEITSIGMYLFTYTYLFILYYCNHNLLLQCIIIYNYLQFKLYNIIIHIVQCIASIFQLQPNIKMTLISFFNTYMFK